MTDSPQSVSRQKKKKKSREEEKESVKVVSVDARTIEQIENPSESEAFGPTKITGS